MFYPNLKCNITFSVTCLKTKTIIHFICRSPDKESLTRRSVVVMLWFLICVKKCFTCDLKYTFDFPDDNHLGRTHGGSQTTVPFSLRWVQLLCFQNNKYDPKEYSFVSHWTLGSPNFYLPSNMGSIIHSSGAGCRLAEQHHVCFLQHRHVYPRMSPGQRPASKNLSGPHCEQLFFVVVVCRFFDFSSQTPLTVAVMIIVLHRMKLMLLSGIHRVCC